MFFSLIQIHLLGLILSKYLYLFISCLNFERIILRNYTLYSFSFLNHRFSEKPPQIEKFFKFTDYPWKIKVCHLIKAKWRTLPLFRNLYQEFPRFSLLLPYSEPKKCLISKKRRK